MRRSILHHAALGALLAVANACAPTLGDDDDAVDDDDTNGDDDDAADDDDTNGDDDDTTGDDDDAVDCAAPPIEASFVLCPDDPEFPWGERLVGAFAEWAVPTARFVTADGQEYSFQLELGGGAGEAPNPSIWSAVSIVLNGRCPARDAYTNLLVFAPDDDDAVLLALGNRLPLEVEGGSVEQRDVGCAAEPAEWCGCAERCRVDALAIGDEAGRAVWTVGQGGALDEGPVHLRAWSMHTREALTCADIPERSAIWGIWLDAVPPDEPTEPPR